LDDVFWLFLDKLDCLDAIREREVGSFALILHLEMRCLDGRLIEALVLFQSCELIGDEREMRDELLIRCVLEERSREGDAVFETPEICLELFALLGQSTEFLFGLVFELLEESLFVLFDLLFELLSQGDDLIRLRDRSGFYVCLHQTDETEGGFDLLASILNSVNQERRLDFLVSNDLDKGFGFVAFVISNSKAERTNRDVALETKQIQFLGGMQRATRNLRNRTKNQGSGGIVGF